MQHQTITDLPQKLKSLQNKINAIKEKELLFIQNGDEGYASAPSNIALIKYWGKEVNRAQYPCNSSLSYTLGGFRSFTKVTALGRFFPKKSENIAKYSNKLILNGKEIEIPAKMEILIHSILNPFANEISLKIESNNNFPTACGIASSASGYAALVGAIADLLQLKKHFQPQELNTWLTEWARLGSGSATRSALECEHESFVKWNKSFTFENNYTDTLQIKHHPKWKSLEHCVIVLNSAEKSVSSSEGHKTVNTSLLHPIRVAGTQARMLKLEKAIREFDFEAMQHLTEEDAFYMHAIMQTGNPPICYLDTNVSNAISLFINMRDKEDAQAFWTLDAGPNIHILYMNKYEEFIDKFLNKLTEKIKKDIILYKNKYREGLSIGKEHFQKINKKDIVKQFTVLHKN